jgi:hypothetical protein
VTPARRPKPQLRILLFSDVVLDRAYEWAPAAVADARRSAAREATLMSERVRRSPEIAVQFTRANTDQFVSVRDTRSTRGGAATAPATSSSPAKL